MKASIIPVICAMALTGMLCAGAAHWWSVHQLASLTGLRDGKLPAVETPVNPRSAPISTPSPSAVPVASQVPPPAVVPPAPAVTKAEPAADKTEREFFTSLVGELKSVRQQNQELRDQVAETNRDLMELQFRVDTHSESFRPLKVASDSGPSQNELSGVLPPRALPAE